MTEPHTSPAEPAAVDRLGADMIKRLQTLNEAILWKLDGLTEYDLRRPLTPTGTNLLGVVKHLASVQAGYFGDCLARPYPQKFSWFAPEVPINADMWATAQESSDSIRELYAASWRHAQETFAVTATTDTGTVPWWPEERRHPTLGLLLVHMLEETARHAGHIDILREQIDAREGRYDADPSIPTADEIDWPAYVAQVQAAADAHR